MTDEPYKMKNLSYIAKQVRLPGESLADFTSQLKQLSPEDKMQLDTWAQQERSVLNV